MKRERKAVGTKVLALAAAAAAVLGVRATMAAQPIIISGYTANPSGSDGVYEYVQLIATQTIDFSATPFSLVVANNGTATSNGWVAGGFLTYGFDLTSGVVNAGDVFYVGGSGKLINGAGSTDISSANWIRTIDTTASGGDGFGNTSTSGVLGNGTTNADGIGVFSGLAGSLTASSVPVDSVFYGTAVGNAKPASGGYVVPDNDHYSTAQGTFGNGTNTFIFGDPPNGGFAKLTGTYNPSSGSWTVARSVSNVALSSGSTIDALATGITLGTGSGPKSITWSPAGGSTAWDHATANWTGGGTTFADGDNVTFGNTGVGTVTIDGAGVTPGSVAISNTSGTYVVTNGGATGLVGSATITKTNAGAVTFASANPTFSGNTFINGGTVNLSAADANGVPGTGTGTLNVASGATLGLQNVKLGYHSDFTPGTGINVILNGGSTLVATGTNGINGTNQYATSGGTITVRVPAAGDSIVIGNSARNAGSGGQTSTTVVRVEGAGTMHLASGGTSSSSTGTQFSGSWVVAMDQNTGILSLGPILNGGFGEVLNALGYQAPASGSGGYNGVTRPITVTSGTLALGADQANKSGSSAPAAATFRSPLTLDGGKVASTGHDYESFDTNAGSTLSTTQVVNAGVSADVTLSANKTSTVLLYDPVAGTGAGSRNFNITSDPYLTPGVVPGPMSWGAGSTLAVDAGGTSGGVLTFSRNFDATNNPVTVGAGAKLSIGSGATVTLTSGGNNGDAGQDSLYDGTNAVSVANAGTLNVTSINTVILMDGPSGFPLTYQTAGVKHVGAITGGGTTNVKDGETLAIVAGSATSIQSAVNVDASSLLDLNNNKLAINYVGSTVADAVRGQLQSGRGSGAWDGATGITTTTGKNDASQATGIGYAEASQVVGAGGGTWAGVGVDGSTLLLKYTYYGDANLDGKVDGSDFTLLDKGFNKHVANAHWTDGDFNYDGSVTPADYLLADTAFGHQSGGVLSPEFLAQRQAEFGDAYVASLVAAVPEPTSLGLVGVAAAGLLGRRRRSAK